jgi:hypothetical protein
MGRDALTEVLDSTSRAVQRKHLEQVRCDQHEYMGSIAVLSRGALERAILKSRGLAQPGIRMMVPHYIAAIRSWISIDPEPSNQRENRNVK